MGSLKVIQPRESGKRVERLSGERSPRLWRSLEELAGTPEHHEALAREFPPHYFETPAGTSGGAGLDRRRFLQLGAASAVLASVAACTKQPPEKIVPYIRQPEEIVPGKPLFFATALNLGGYARPVLAESHMGRPTKLEGNPEHPASLGATDLLTQASVLELYDPDRAQAITRYGRLRSWTDFAAEIQSAMRAFEGLEGAGLRILTGAVSSPTLAAQLRGLLARLPKARWHVWEPAAGNGAAGSRMAFGEALEAVYHLTEADVVVTLDADLLTEGPGSVRYARDFASRRRVGEDGVEPHLNRLYAIESTPTSTGSVADHRLALPPSEIAAFALALAAELGLAELPAGAPGFSRSQAAPWIRALARDLKAHAGSSLVVAGAALPPEVHALVHAINEALGNAGRTVTYVGAVLEAPQGPGDPPAASLGELVQAMREGQVETLILLDGNPVFDAPADYDFAGALDKVGRRVYVGLYENETAASCHWFVPRSHELESWGDGRAYDGTVTFTQPLINPLYDSRDPYQILALLDGRTDATAYELIEEYWASLGVSGERFRKAIHDGFLEGSAPAVRSLPVSGTEGAAGRIAEAWSRRGEPGRSLELVLRPDPTIHDGRFNNNGWLQECPKPLTKLTWDNALLIAPALAARQGLSDQDVVRLRAPEGHTGAAELEVPVWVLPGHSEQAATLHLGYGRQRTGAVGAGTGVDAYPLRTSESLWTIDGVTLEKTGRTVPLASTQDHSAMEGRGQVRFATLEHYHEHPDFAQHVGHAPGPEESFFEPYEYNGYAWGLAVDLNACTGCNACVVACQAENNISVVGKEQVLNGREMHWIRIDRYFEGSLDDPAVYHQPVMCQHCEQAPCEVVCPVAATVHSDEGLNDMVYNRCVGTRYCSNNCPYKVRRFNFLEYNDLQTPILRMLRNPDVTVRERGVMEKCSFCVQRINGARQQAKVEGRKIRDREILTACQQACPSQAIAFGDINQETSEISRWKARPTNYQLLAELNTRPRTSYLAQVRNPNPELTRS